MALENGSREWLILENLISSEWLDFSVKLEGSLPEGREGDTRAVVEDSIFY